MRRLVVSFSVATLSLVGGVIGTSAVASGSTDTTVPSDAATEVHPIVGAWLLRDDDLGPDAPLHPGAFSSDGIYWQIDAEGVVGIGAWEPTGPNSAALTFFDRFPDEAGDFVTDTVRALIEVAPDGQSWTAEYTVEFSGGDFPEGEYGPGSASATRIAVEPMGTPAGTFEDLFALFEEGTTPAGTEPVGTTPADTTPADTTPTGTEPAGTTPTDTAVATSTG